MSQFPPQFPQQPVPRQFRMPAPPGSGTEDQSRQQSTQPQSIPLHHYAPQTPMQSMPPAPKPKHHLRKGWIMVAGIVVVVALFAAVAGILHTHEQNSVPTSTIQGKVTRPSSQPTQTVDHPTAQPTSAPTQAAVSITQAILGADLSTFTAKYGQVITVQGGYYTFKANGIEVMFAGNDPPPYATRALAIVYNPPSGHLLSVSDATNACAALSPSDAHYLYSLTLTGAVERVYFSASLAKQFPASEFVDGHLKATKPGTFGIVLNYGPGSNTQVASCSTQVSLQGN